MQSKGTLETCYIKCCCLGNHQPITRAHICNWLSIVSYQIVFCLLLLTSETRAKVTCKHSTSVVEIKEAILLTHSHPSSHLEKPHRLLLLPVMLAECSGLHCDCGTRARDMRFKKSPFCQEAPDPPLSPMGLP